METPLQILAAKNTATPPTKNTDLPPRKPKGQSCLLTQNKKTELPSLDQECRVPLLPDQEYRAPYSQTKNTGLLSTQTKNTGTLFP